MKNIKPIIFVFILLVFGLFGFSQEGYFYQFKLVSETKIQGNKIFFKELKNTGTENQLDINLIVQDNLNFYYNTYSGIEKKNIQNHISWMREPLFQKASTESEASVVISGSYFIKTNTSLEEKLFYERQSNVGGAIPYYEIRQINMAEVQLIISYTYPNKKVLYDTIYSMQSYERKPGTKFLSVDDLLQKCEQSVKSQLDKKTRFYSHENVYYKFLKVKTSDKLLKEEIKLASELLNNGNLKKLGSIYLKIFNADNSNIEAAFNVALCYELLGNYPKAEEFFAKMPDFHAKIRMKSNLQLYHYLKEIGANMPLIDF